QHLAASERVMGARSTHCAAGVWPALACGGGEDGGGAACGAGICAVPGSHTGSTGGAKSMGDDAVAGGGGLPALRGDPGGDAARASPELFAGAAFGSGFMMLTAGIDAALGKSGSMIAFFLAWFGSGWLTASVAVGDGAASATGVSGCPHSGKLRSRYRSKVCALRLARTRSGSRSSAKASQRPLVQPSRNASVWAPKPNRSAIRDG